MRLQGEEINNILKEHNGDLLDNWFGSSSEYNSNNEWVVNFDSGCCSLTGKSGSNFSRAVVALKENKEVKEVVEGNFLCEHEQPINWEQRRYEIARDALVGLLAAPVIPGINPCPPISDSVELAIDYADALIEKLKK